MGQDGQTGEARQGVKEAVELRKDCFTRCCPAQEEKEDKVEVHRGHV